MNIFEELEQSFKTLTIQKITPQIFNRSDVLDVSEELQRAQYQAGQTSLGKDTFYGKYAKSTERYPRSTPISSGDIIKLKDTGQFYKDIKATNDKDSILMENKNSKLELLEEAYGDTVVGLHEESLSELSDFILTTEIAQNIIYDNL